MKSVTLRTKIITGVITGGMLLSSVSLVFATGTNSTNTAAVATSKTEFRQPKAQLELTLKLGVSAGIITQAESDKILAYQVSKIKEKTVKIDLYKGLVDNNILTRAKADALKASEQVQRQKTLDTNLAKLVTDKTLTQDQSDKIKAAIASQDAARKIEMEKTKGMTKAQRKAYMESNKRTHVNALKALVDAGTITKAQADKVGPCGPLGGPGKHGKDMKHGTPIDPTIQLAKLVTDKTITQAQADSIKVALASQDAARKIEMEKTKGMTEVQRKAYMESNKGTHVNALKALVDARTITQAQADKVGPGAHNHMSGPKIK